jgi:ubiquinone/menaquinone biosynthesis C-methylase UbiE
MQTDADRREWEALQRTIDLRDKRVLEIGCGDGRLSWQYAKVPRLVVGIDVDSAELNLARIDAPPAVAQRLRLTRASATNLPFRGACFEVVIFSWSF